MAKNIAKVLLILILIAAIVTGCYFVWQYAVDSGTGDGSGSDSAITDTSDSEGFDSSVTDSSSSISTSASGGSDTSGSGSDSSSGSSSTGDSTSGGTDSSFGSESSANYLSTKFYVYGESSKTFYTDTYTGELNSVNASFSSYAETLCLVIGITLYDNYESVFKAGTEYTVTLTCVDGLFDFCDYCSLRSVSDFTSTKITATETVSGLTATFTPSEDMTCLYWLTDSSTAGDYNFNVTVTY